MTDVRTFTVGPIQENCHIVRADEHSRQAVIVDPGEEPDKLLHAIAELEVEINAILLTHCHFDHIGAVAPVAEATGADVYCPVLEAKVLEDIMRWVPPGFGPFESYTPQHTLSGGERLRIAGMQIETLFTPGHSPGHLTYAITSAAPSPASTAASEAPPAASEAVPASSQAPPASSQEAPPASQTPAIPTLLSGDVLFQGSVGRVDLPGGDWPTLQRSIQLLIERFPLQAKVVPGHLANTTLQQELQSNPFLSELRQAAAVSVTRRTTGS